MAPGYTVEPIQIAASNLEFDGLKLLLKSGADPKGTGDVDGTIGTPNRGPLLAWYAWIRGESALHLVRKLHFSRIDHQALSELPYEKIKKIDDLIVSHGARDFTLLECPGRDEGPSGPYFIQIFSNQPSQVGKVRGGSRCQARVYWPTFGQRSNTWFLIQDHLPEDRLLPLFVWLVTAEDETPTGRFGFRMRSWPIGVHLRPPPPFLRSCLLGLSKEPRALYLKMNSGAQRNSRSIKEGAGKSSQIGGLSTYILADCCQNRRPKQVGSGKGRKEHSAITHIVRQAALRLKLISVTGKSFRRMNVPELTGLCLGRSIQEAALKSAPLAF
ncbi:uncharacterized protein PODANS_1_4980 [Podospora anserina S mat+]|uniref:Podospora anserina S mat+ genomic DNA chromosome 1, supercontig 1 n=1 Tax=Podospora anserina (strain S / ATCC MYA-4624 / DSM 980 / FGSC 10383) TaxID=515849 RepID=B2AAS1_PODAN|nr:uncharacterized protein PODANS_1_4980 [Podospora anserina S mat+]CAP60183.1 unnamed protein product [Podospora anserina S mat+]CDP22823.1 Putative protein of unknown function [Podospora anserina S mat+]